MGIYMLISRCFVKHRVISGCLPAVCRCLEHSRNFTIALQVAALSEPEGKEAPLLSAAPRRTTRPRGSGAGPAAALIPPARRGALEDSPWETWRGRKRKVVLGRKRKCLQCGMAAAVSALGSLGDLGDGGSSGSEDEAQPSAAEVAAAQKREERLRKFRELHLKRNEARKLNHQEVVEEDKRLKLPPNWEAKKARLEWELKVEEKKKECAARGEDYERVKLLEISAEDAERWERKKKRKNPDLGFSDYAAAQLRQYQRLTRQIKPDLEQYEKLKEQYGEALYPTSDSLLHGTHVPDKEGIDRMVADLEKQIEKREKYSRRRPYNDDADIDYINERNAKFNKKAERFYGKYTAEIKQNLERGTAV